MADMIEINISNLKGDIQDMQTEIGEIRRIMAQAYQAVGELDAMWDGPANIEFNKAFNNDRAAMEELCKIVDHLIGYMENARDEYTKCEAAVSAAIDGIRI